MARNWFTIQLWSLSVEEQFYLVWPLVLLKVGKGIPRRQFFAAALLFAMGCGVIVLVHIGRLFHLGGLHWMPYIKFGGLVVGCCELHFPNPAQPRSSEKYSSDVPWEWSPRCSPTLWHFTLNSPCSTP
jgi:peptidoglycan/LPS O-acetylase OafA/YrhL